MKKIFKDVIFMIQVYYACIHMFDTVSLPYTSIYNLNIKFHNILQWQAEAGISVKNLKRCSHECVNNHLLFGEDA